MDICRLLLHLDCILQKRLTRGPRSVQQEQLTVGPRPDHQQRLTVVPRSVQQERLTVGPRRDQQQQLTVGPRSVQQERLTVGPQPDQQQILTRCQRPKQQQQNPGSKQQDLDRNLLPLGATENEALPDVPSSTDDDFQLFILFVQTNNDMAGFQEHIEIVQSFEQLENLGYKFHPVRVDPAHHPTRKISSLPNPKTLKGPVVCFLPQSPHQPKQLIRKIFPGVEYVPYVRLYIKYFAHTVRNRRNPDLVKEIYVSPCFTDGANRQSLLPVTPYVGWNDCIVKLDFRHPINTIEIGVKGFEPRDCFVIKEFAVIFDTEVPEDTNLMERIAQSMPPIEEQSPGPSSNAAQYSNPVPDPVLVPDAAPAPDQIRDAKQEPLPPRGGFGFGVLNCILSILYLMLWFVRFFCPCLFSRREGSRYQARPKGNSKKLK